jgi:hypothetical protein
MSVERRYSFRHWIDCPVHIRYRRRRFCRARGRNLCAEGMFLEVQSLTLPTGTLVELELDLDGADWLVPAIVVHHQAGGVGVMFREPRPELLQSLGRSRGRSARLPGDGTAQACPLL